MLVTGRCGSCSTKKKKKSLQVFSVYLMQQITKLCKIISKTELSALLSKLLITAVKGQWKEQWVNDLAKYTFGPSCAVMGGVKETIEAQSR